MLNQGAMEFSSDVAEYFKKHHVSVILLIRKNVLRRLISILANAYDRKTQLVGVHKSHTHSKEEVRRALNQISSSPFPLLHTTPHTPPPFTLPEPLPHTALPFPSSP
ncbi:unnamed protein product [Closterium sp. NIES-53]